MAQNVTPMQNRTGASPGAPAANNNSPTAPEQLFTPSSTRGESKAPESGLEAAVKDMEDNVNDVDVMLAELKMMDSIFREGEKKARDALIVKWCRKILGSTTVVPLVGVRNGKLRIVHTVAEYQAGFGEESEYDEALIGFMGDRTRDKIPMPIKLNAKRVSWQTYKGTFTSEATLRTFYSSDTNATKFYVVQESDSTSDLLLPALLQVPRGYIQWLNETPRTPFEFHEKLLADLGGDEPDNRPQVLAVPLAFLQRACTAGKTDSTKSKSVAEMVVEPVFGDDSPAFGKWLEGRLNTTLGLPPASVVQTIVNNVYKYPEAPPSQSPFAAGGTPGGGAVPSQDGASATKRDKAALSPLQKSALKGFSQALHDHELAEVWSKLETTSEPSEIRRYVNEAWENSRQELGLDLGECTSFFMEDTTLKEWKKVEFAPGGAIPVWDYLMRGMSILLCTNFSTEAQLKAQDREQAWQETMYTRTADEATRRSRREPRQPPRSWSNFKYVLNTYAVFLHAFFTAACPHFKASWSIREVLVTLRERTRYFTPHVCALLTYHVIKDSRQFFSIELMPSDFEGGIPGEVRARGRVPWPESHLFDVAKHLFKLQFASLEVADLPIKWQEPEKESTKEASPAAKRPAQDFGNSGRYEGGPAEWRSQQQGNGGQGFFTPNTHGNHRHVHMPPQLREQLGRLVEECVKLCPMFGFYEMREFAGLDVNKMPRLTKYISPNGNSNSMCHMGMLGVCKFDDSSCRYVRVDPRDLTDDFVQEYIRVVKPALEKCLEALRQGKKARRPSPAGRGGRGGFGGAGRYGPAQF